MQISSRPAARALAYFPAWLIAPLFSLWLHWEGLFTWFLADDFAFLGLHRDVTGWSSFWKVILTPSAVQGSFRPLSERAFFLLFWRWFGLDALPYHALVFLTHAISLVLLYGIVLRVTRSRVAAVLAPTLWTANASLADPLGWTCGYNEILCGLFLLTALALWMMFEETGRVRYYILSTAVFLLGFGSLELNIVFPALAAAWSLLRGRRRMALLTLPLFALSMAFYAVHAAIARTPQDGPYALHFDLSMLYTFCAYWKWSVVIFYWKEMPGYISAIGGGAVVLVTAAIVLFVGNEARKRNFSPLYFLLWFVVTLSPLLPLRDHRSAYYLAIPSLGIAAVLAMLATRYRTGIAVAAVYLAAAIPASRAQMHFNYARANEVKGLVLGVKKAIDLHPGKAILLTNVSADLYGAAIVHRPFRVFTDAAVYLAPEALAQSGVIDREWPSVANYTLPPGPALRALQDERLEVYSAADSPLRNTTQSYGETAPKTLSSDPPSQVDAGDALEAYLLGPGWYPLEGIYRWMNKRASVRMGGPTRAGRKLVLSGICVEQLVRGGPATIAVNIDGVKLATEQQLTRAESFEREFALPPDAVGKRSMNVEVELSATFRDAPNTRELGLVFGTLAIR